MYELEVSEGAVRQIRRLSVELQERVNSAIGHLKDNPRPQGGKKLRGLEGYRVRVGDYRVLYRVYDAEQRVVVWRVMSREDVYRRG